MTDYQFANIAIWTLGILYLGFILWVVVMVIKDLRSTRQHRRGGVCKWRI